MIVDYDLLKDLLDKCTTGQWQSHEYEPDPYCYPGATRFVISADWDRVEIAEGHAEPSTESSEYARKSSDFTLMSLAPDIARELIRLHDGVESALAEMHDIATALRRIENHNVAFAVEQCALLLTRILEGENQ